MGQFLPFIQTAASALGGGGGGGGGGNPISSILGNVAGLFGGGGDDAAKEAARARMAAAVKFQRQYNAIRDQAGAGTFLGDAGLTDIFGTRPEAALYEPVSINSSLLNSILGNLATTGATSDLASETNRINAEQALSRISSTLPGYSDSLASYDGATQALLRGELPFDDVLGIVSNRNELGAALGTPGTSTNATLKDLGLARLQATQQGGSMFQSILGALNQNVNPVQNLYAAQSNYLTPSARLQTDIAQSQLAQQSQQSANFLAASPDPGISGIFNTDLGINSAVASMKAGAAAASAGSGGSSTPWGDIVNLGSSVLAGLFNPSWGSGSAIPNWGSSMGGMPISARPF